jgi:co-chaperonin GroES (HSP10)
MSSILTILDKPLSEAWTRLTKKKWNQSGLRPVGHAVLLEPYEPDFDAARRIGIVIPDNLRERSIMVEMRARVLELGDQAYRKDGQTWISRLFTPHRPRCRPGDKVLVQVYSGALVQGTMDGKVYRLVNDEDIFVQIAEEAEKPNYGH